MKELKFTNPGQVERQMRETGIKNAADIWDLETFPRIEARYNILPDNIFQDFSETEISPELRACLEEIRHFCLNITKIYRDSFLELLLAYGNKHKIPQSITDYLCEQDLLLPTFIISRTENAELTLDKLGLEGDIYPDEFFVSFQLPKPLAEFWWKGGINEYNDKVKDIGQTSIEWRHFYTTLMHIVWKVQGFYENERNLIFNRINNNAQHDPKQYYYVWTISSGENLDD